MSNSSGCPSVPTSQILIDDRNPRIIYSGAWVQDPGRPGMECQATTHGSGLNNGSAMAAFTFNGVGIQVFGTVGVNDGSPVSSYQVDDLPSYTLDFQANGQMNFQYQFYSSPPLDTGPHTLVINVPGKEGSQLFLDYIIYNLSASVTSTVVPSSTTSTTGSTASATLQVDISTTSTSTTSTAAFTSDNRTTSPITSHGSSTSHATSSLTVVSSSSSSTTLSLPAAAASGPSSASHSSPVGAVVGGTVGGIIGLALGIFVTCFVMRKHRRRVAELTNRNSKFRNYLFKMRHAFFLDILRNSVLFSCSLDLVGTSFR
ncbi:hypothetical protein GYMLUDRAFT_70363 [Collybiopsis luxurians FD-317 M1]|nr:hypothetical protein GYMLUDRAFT_70363 [Collybiopsis luxurians FD-317 M1]